MWRTFDPGRSEMFRRFLIHQKLTQMSNHCLRNARPWIMEMNSSFAQTPEDGCKAQQPKRRDTLSLQDEDKNPNISPYNSLCEFYDYNRINFSLFTKVANWTRRYCTNNNRSLRHAVLCCIRVTNKHTKIGSL